VIRSLYDRIRRELTAAGVDAAAFEAGQLLQHFAGIGREQLLMDPHRTISEEQKSAVLTALEKRLQGQPLQYLLGFWEFYGLEFAVGPGVLIPRADTETLVETALAQLASVSAPRVLDLCSGSGCIAAAIAHHRPEAAVYAVEASDAAFCYLQKNVAALAHQNLHPVLGDLFALDPMDFAPLDALLSNPPYLTAEECDAVSPEVACEPRMALDGGADGLIFYREIASRWKTALRPGGLLAFEVGWQQADDVADILCAEGFAKPAFAADIAGIRRCVYARLQG